MSTESRRIRNILEILKRFPASASAGFEASVPIAALDDCAVVPLPGEMDLVVGSDFVRGVGFHLFRRGILSYRDIGYYLIGADASDLAAMGASPLGALVVLRYTSEMTDEDCASIMTGVAEACSHFSMPLLGGDTGSYETCVLAATAFGLCPRGRSLVRAGGKAEDILFVTGDVGRARAALAYFVRLSARIRTSGHFRRLS